MIGQCPKLHENVVKHLLIKDDLPFLMLKDRHGETPLDAAVNNYQIKNIQQLLSLILHHSKSHGEISHLFNPVIGNNLIKLISMNLDIKDILTDSEILITEITHDSYPGLHFNRDKVVLSAPS